jgi:hypothetical protein
MKKLTSYNMNQIENRIMIKGVHFYPPDTINKINEENKFTIQKALTLGTKYSPIPSIKIQKTEIQDKLMNNFKNFKNNIKIKIYFTNKQNISNRKYDPDFYIKSNNQFEPNDKEIPNNVLSFLNNTEEDLHNKINYFIQNEKIIIKNLRKTYDINESQNFIKIIKEISKDSNLIIKPADKNLGLTVMDASWYDNEISNQLHNDKYYTRCLISKSEIIQIVNNKYLNMLNYFPIDNEHEFHLNFLTNSPQIDISRTDIPKFYILPKLHKETVKGRPIVASCNWITTPLSKYCNWVLQNEIMDKIENNISIMLKNSIQLINEIEDMEISDTTYLVTFDIESLYTNINQDEASKIILAILYKSFNSNMGFCILHPMIIYEFLNFIFNNNYIMFNDQIFKQHYGIAMGTSVAPTIANIYMWDLENKLFNKLNHINSKLIPKKYYRYLDDIFMLWDRSLDELINFKDIFNSMDPNIKLTMNHDLNTIDYLDLIIYKNNNKINFKVHQKALNKYLYIPYNSNHPKHIYKGVIKTELIRYIRNSSNITDYIEIKKKFYGRLRERGYPKKLLLNYLNNDIYYKDRSNYLTRMKHRKLEHNIIPFVLQYCPLINNLKIPRLINQNWNNMIIKSDGNKKYCNLKPMVSWKTFNNLLSIINKNNKFRIGNEENKNEDNQENKAS